MPKQKKHSRASALLLATILLFAILTVIISLSSVTVMEMKMGQKGKSSVVSFYSAESGVEWALHKIASSSGNLSDASLSPATDGSVNCPDALGADCKVYFLNESGNVIPAANFSSTEFSEVRAVRSIGSQGNETQRAIEAAVAVGGDDSLSGGTLLASPINFYSKSVEGSYSGTVARQTYSLSGVIPPSAKAVILKGRLSPIGGSGSSKVTIWKDAVSPAWIFLNLSIAGSSSENTAVAFFPLTAQQQFDYEIQLTIAGSGSMSLDIIGYAE